MKRFMEIKKVAIIGLGALGILFGAQIVQKIGDDLTIIAYDTGTFRLSCPSSCDTLKKTGGEIRNGKTSPG